MAVRVDTQADARKGRQEASIDAAESTRPASGTKAPNATLPANATRQSNAKSDNRTSFADKVAAAAAASLAEAEEEERRREEERKAANAAAAAKERANAQKLAAAQRAKQAKKAVGRSESTTAPAVKASGLDVAAASMGAASPAATRPETQAISADQVEEAVANGESPMEDQIATGPEASTGFVDTDTGEVVNNTISRQAAKPEAPRRSTGQKTGTIPQRTGNTKSVTPLASDVVASSPTEQPMGNTDARAQSDGMEILGDDDARDIARKEEEAERLAARKESPTGVQGEFDIDLPLGWTAIPKKVKDRKVGKYITKMMDKATRQTFVRARDRLRRANGMSPTDSIGIDAQNENPDFEDYSHVSEPYLKRKYEEAREQMLLRIINPWHLRIEGEHIEYMRDENGNIVTDKNGNRYARVRWGDAEHKEVEHAIGTLARMYDCSWGDVLALIQLRAGLGVDSHGRIANVDPDKFTLRKDQLLELVSDIQKSQRAYGHPLAVVEGVPGGVRDGTGKFVVVAKTRCYPIGYIPRSLIDSLSRGQNSVLHDKSAHEIQAMVRDNWLHETYPTLLANASGNVAYQARAIENQMRGLMQADEVDPGGWNIPELVINKNLMMAQAERISAGDEDMKRAHDERFKRLEEDLSLWIHRYMKSSGSRGPDGSIKSGLLRRRNTIGDQCRGVSSWSKICKASNILLWASSPVEALQAEVDQSIANALSDLTFSMLNKDIAGDYRMTDALDAASRSDEAAQAHSVASALYRIGGHMAMNAFMGARDGNGNREYHLTYADLKRFLQDTGYSPSSTITDKMRQAFGIKPGEESAFMMNAQAVMNGIESVLLGTSELAQRYESSQFVKRSMAEMGRIAAHNRQALAEEGSLFRGSGEQERRETYTNKEVEGFANDGEELVWSLLMTDAGREAFMTQGVTSLGRKSPWEHAMRVMLTKNGATELAFRTMFDRFPEYGLNKILRQMPYSNTVSYLATFGIKGLGDIAQMNGVTSSTNEWQRAWEYQMGSTYYRGDFASFMVGLRKNMLYDTVMGASKLVTAGLVCYLIQAFGGIHEPPEQEDRYTMSEWLIGDEEHAIPVKLAWWMDDLSGISVPLGVAWAIADQGDYSPLAVGRATNVFINGIVNLNDGTVVLDAIDLVRNFDSIVSDALGADMDEYGIDANTWFRTRVEVALVHMLGDMTPTVIGQIIPQSRDYIFRGDDDAHTASYVFAAGEGQFYDMETAQGEYHVRYLDKTGGDYEESELRHATQNNWIAGFLFDVLKGYFREDSNVTSYRYGLMPISTMTDPKDRSSDFDEFQFSFADLPEDQEDREAEENEHASKTCQYILDNYQNVTQATNDGFVLNSDARTNCRRYCYEQIDRLRDEIDRVTRDYKLYYGITWIDNDEYERLTADYQEQIDSYNTLLDEFLDYRNGVPYRLPRYKEQETDYETRYVDEHGRPATYVDYVMGNAERELYPYGNVPTQYLPLTSPRTANKGYNFETIPYWVHLDDDGNIINDTGAIYDRLANMTVTTGRDTGSDTRELMYGGQGNNMRDDVSEELNIGREEVPTIGRRNWRIDETLMPEELQDIQDDPVKLRELCGLDPLPEKDEPDGQSDGPDGDDYVPYYGGYYGGGGYYGSYYGGGGGGYSSYTPRIYSTTHSVYPSRASGMGVRTPYRPTNTYLRPSYSTKGSREAYRRNDL